MADIAEEGAKSVLKNLIPPGTPIDDPRWRWSMTVSSILGLYGIHIIWACGLFALIGIPLHGFVVSTDLDATRARLEYEIKHNKAESDAGINDLKSGQQTTQILLITGALKDDVKDVCGAERSGNQQALDADNRTLATDLANFRDLAGYSWPGWPADCNSILVGPAH